MSAQTPLVSAFLCYSLVILLSAGAPRQWLRYVAPVIAIWLVHSITSSFVFALVGSVYIGLTYLLRTIAPARLASRFLWLCWGVLTLGLLTHTLPGYQGFILAANGMVKPDSVAVTLYVNTDKVLVAWSVMQWLSVWGKTSKQPVPRALQLSYWQTGLAAVAGISGILWGAVLLGLVNWQPLLTPLIATLMVSNLLNTCVTEELLFRGGLQRLLQRKMTPLAGLIVASAVFGAAHFSGGEWYMLLATLAGLLYGTIYWLTGRLLWAIICHWGLNVTHMLLFSWPMLPSASA
ncbi:CPBP family intramembrane glutamic endopeptidase [Alteromonas gilva]|uniref:CPBP family intramembrane metalloprotease n=1 Tax=Alteromonas gilva TaxID=2987522 RepID=A0ABT5KYQ2_9ALTE|nr:CPBP family intramembrane glutamic endopeptidase [Alteromonas gilva]MDC8829909.1 CPBP family intramembrane metalloprotease [Alteromonas gilva]